MTTSWKDYIDFIISKGDIDELMIVDSSDGALWCSSSPNFILKEYKALITQEDGSDVEQVVNEAVNLCKFIQGGKPLQGLRLNGKKYQVIRSFKDDDIALYTIYGKITQGGSCITHAGRCVLIATFSEAKGHTSAACNEVMRLMSHYLHKSTWPDDSRNSNSNNDKSTSSNAAGSSSSQSWQVFIDKMLIGKGGIADALICSKDDGKLFASSAGFMLKKYQAEIPQEDGSDKLEDVDEMKNLIMIMGGKKPSQGLRINETKFQIIKQFQEEHSDCFTVYGKKGLVNVCAIVTNKVIVLALCDEKKGHTAVNCNSCVSDLAKHLKSSNN